MAKTYELASTVKMIAEGLIGTHHPDLADARIQYVYASKGGMKNGRPLAGKARKVSGVWEHLTETDFLIEVAKDMWDEMTGSQRTALVDHLLEHCTGEVDEDSGETSWKMRDPDIQEFTTIVERHGAWHQGLHPFIQVAQQIELDDLIAEETEEVDLAENLISTEE